MNWQDQIVSDKEVLLGKPIIKVTRINDFKIEFIDPPQTIEFNRNSSIPNDVIKNDFKLVFLFKDKHTIEFPIGTFYEALQLESKNNYSSEPREIKLISSDNKIVLFLVLMIE